jgi:tetratricopeptide (TPR) repeat protein
LSSSLHDKIKNHSVHIALLNPHHPTRVAMIKVLHKLGYQHIAICKSPSDLLSKIRTSRIDWVISTLLDDQRYTMLDLLQTFYDDIAHHKVRFSFILHEKQIPVLPQAYSNGLLSWFDHATCGDMKAFEAEFLEFQRLLEDHHQKGQHEAYVAAHYFRRYLRTYMIWGELIALEKALTDAFPLQTHSIMALAEAYFLAGEYTKGRQIVNQAQQISSESLDHHIEVLLQKFPKALLKKQGTLADRFDMQHVVVIERDDRELQILRSALKRTGVGDFKAFSSLTSAWDEIKNGPEPDLVISEWSKRQGDLSTMQFLQRIRSHGFASVPLIVMVSQLRPQESQILHDVGMLQLMQKPLREDHVVIALAYSVQQAKQPNERRPIEQKIIQCLLGGNKAYAYHLRKAYHADKTIVPSRKYYIEALFNYHHGNFTKARNHLIKGIKLSVQEKGANEEIRPNLDKTILLAKCLFRLGDKSLAIQMLEKARQRSPFNISILLALMEMNFDVGNVNQASAAIEEAEKIDSGNAQVIQAGAKLSLLTGSVEKATHFLRSMDNRNDIIQRMNNQAVSFIQSGEFRRGIELYQSAIKALPKEETDLLGVVYYNLALAFLRNDEWEAGLTHLETSAGFTGSRVYKRATSLRKRIEESQNSGRKIKFASNLAATAARGEKEKLLGFVDGLVMQRHPSVALLNLYRYDRRDRQEEQHFEDSESSTSTEPQSPVPGKKEAS